MFSFEWDDHKSETNQKKHGVTFDEASTVFYDDYARIIDDPDHSEFEARFVILGFSIAKKLLMVCHCYRENEKIVRIISARKATKCEANQYWSFYEKRI